METPNDNETSPAMPGCAPTTCYALLDAAEAPKDGTVILAAVGWPWLVPAMWCEYAQEWVIAQHQVDYLHGSSCCHFESETEQKIIGWIPIPKLPKGTPIGGFLPHNAGGMARELAAQKPESPTNQNG